jgi:hypothetical protein
LLATGALSAVIAVAGVAFWVSGISRRSQPQAAQAVLPAAANPPLARPVITLVSTPIRIVLVRPTASPSPQPSATPAPTVAPKLGVTLAPTLEPTRPALAGPIFAPEADLNDGRPSYVCSVDTPADAHLLQLIQMAGIDERNGFHLGIQVKLDANTPGDGAVDCQITTLDRVALLDTGVVTLVVGESAGADAIWSRQLSTLDALKGRRLAVVSDSASEYFALMALRSRAAPGAEAVEIVRFASSEEAQAAYQAGETDAISIRATADASGSLGRVLISTRDVRSVVDVVATSQRSIDERAATVQAFHRAWFEALKLQSTDFPAAAKLIAAWGRPELTGIALDTAQRDWRVRLNSLAQADLRQNVAALTRAPHLGIRAADASAVWRRAGKSPSAPDGVRRDPRFAQAAADAFAKDGQDFRGVFPNTTFSLADETELALAPTIAVIGGPQTPSPAPLSIDNAP